MEEKVHVEGAVDDETIMYNSAKKAVVWVQLLVGSPEYEGQGGVQ